MSAFDENTLIRAENLTKTFGSRIAVDDISFTVERGEVLGVLGPNGAGKSTAIRMLAGFMFPTAGRVTIGGHDIGRNPLAAKRLIGYLPEDAPGYPDMTVHAFLEFMAEMRGLRHGAKQHAVDRVVDLCLLRPVLYQTIETLSKGYKHRTALAQALLSDPPVLILDEPTDGLDPNQKHDVRALIRRMGSEKAIVLTTHILEEVDAMCSRVVVIDHGRIVANATPAELRARSALAGTVHVRIAGADAGALCRLLTEAPGAQRVEILDEARGRIEARVYPLRPASAALSGTIAGIATREGWALDEIHTEEGCLEDVFRNITLPETAGVAEQSTGH